MKRTARRLVILEITIWLIGTYLFSCIALRPPQRYIDRTVNYRFTPRPMISTVVSTAYGSSSFPRMETFLPLPYYDWGGLTIGGAHHEVSFVVDIPRTIYWLAGVAILTGGLSFYVRRKAASERKAVAGGFEVVSKEGRA